MLVTPFMEVAGIRDSGLVFVTPRKVAFLGLIISLSRLSYTRIREDGLSSRTQLPELCKISLSYDRLQVPARCCRLCLSTIAPTVDPLVNQTRTPPASQLGLELIEHGSTDQPPESVVVSYVAGRLRIELTTSTADVNSISRKYDMVRVPIGDLWLICTQEQQVERFQMTSERVGDGRVEK
nr:hypothetical protein Iba_chr14aCG15350 [Ipomoea batatas]